MRPLEIIIPALLAIYLLWPHPRPLVIRLIPALALILILIHLYVEGYRWQMIPIYGLTLILVISSLIKITNQADWSTLASTLTVILLLLSTALPILLPVPRIPTPSGPLQIGTSIYEFTDTTRKEKYSGKDEARRFMVQVWYPANITAEDERAPWVSDAKTFAPAIATYINLPSYFLNHLALVDIPAYKDAPIAQTDNGYPVILFSHGWNGFNAQNTGQALELASHGYVVIAIQHTYGAVITVFPDGAVALNNPKALPEDADDPNYEIVARRLVDQWAGDMSFVLNQFQDWDEDADSFFFQKLDMERIGVYGHSTGGGAAIQFCGIDPRCKAVLGMDPFMRPVSAEVIESGVPQPSFFMFSQSWAEITDSKNNQLFNQFYPSVSQSKGAVVINGTKHYDFSDLPLLSPIAPQLGLKGQLNGKQVTEIINSYLLDFFELTLNNKPSKLFDGSFDDFSEVKVR
ncbi:MAG: acetylxylan esterase [Anaerolineales bacterium]|nr:acetylxylan esterase [Anaerolineales bacterium]